MHLYDQIAAYRAEPDRPRLVVGLMSGTSGDGIGAALVETSGVREERRATVVAHGEYPFPPELRNVLFSLYPPNCFDGERLLRAHLALGSALAQAAEHVLETAGASSNQLFVVGLHGPTLYHLLPGADGNEAGFLDVGEAAVVAEQLGVPVVSDLRVADCAAGGSGAPLSAFVDYVLFRDEVTGRAVQNVGGIANVTPLYPKSRLDSLVAYDTGPGNMVIDAVVERITAGQESFDRDGRRAAAGHVHSALLTQLLDHPYFRRVPPKTTGREEFGTGFVDRVFELAGRHGVEGNDLVATVTALTASSIAQSYREHLLPRGRIDEIVLYGGGARNRTLVRMLEEYLPGLRIRMHSEFGVSIEAREALTWAVLADESLLGYPANVPSVSGARHPVVLGKLSVGPAFERGEHS
ncbi:anhydro-N-acetylmuramic acid kinase [Limnochorda pilosa]|uniref:Anhydro-N-acetylmuramic acid kinase n=1 Tax=Limnochorda pilosa TaxID=1555112 RepID=A0A0K2SHR1_LIMPI|nr:anhydro-N-acetylmuramic acid kinase [Limnochorda pilosa]BAS26374.1 anhydro-N-acetylmuramic acid kinase [Limnochorda pilosa]